jgi:hypothetical protein
MAIIHMAIMESVQALPLPNARRPHDTSLSYPWVARTAMVNYLKYRGPPITA